MRIVACVALAATAAVALPLLRPIPQPASYHAFADARTAFGVSNFQNVATNAPFLFVGAAGLVAVRRAAGDAAWMRAAYATFFVAVAAVAFGSGWYHLEPTTPRLTWDRLPMSVAFGALTAVAFGERFGPRAARALLAPLVLASVASVIYWDASERAGAGDLRPYLLAQALPGLWIVALFAPFRKSDDLAREFGLLLLWYVVAKLLEIFDVEVQHAALGAVSGHALKHVAAAFGTWRVVVLARRRIGRGPVERSA